MKGMNKALRDYLKAEKRMNEYRWSLYMKSAFLKEPFFKVRNHVEKEKV